VAEGFTARLVETLRRAHRDLGGKGGSVADSVCACQEKFRSVCKKLSPDYEHEGKQYCVLHSPTKDKNLTEFEDAIKEKLNDKDFDFRGIYFPGNQSFASLLPDSTFEGEADFSSTTFEGEADFSSTIFKGEANFTLAIFKEHANFSSATFERDAKFRVAKFKALRVFKEPAGTVKIFKREAATFSSAAFVGNANFYNAIFERQANFDGATFQDVNFAGTVFSSAKFENAVFRHNVTFTGATLGTTADSNADFRRTTFEGELYCKEVTFNGYTDFYRATFLDAVRFVGGEMAQDAVPSEVFAPEGRVSFSRARIEKPELVSFHMLQLRPNWFVGVDARKFDFTGVEWYGLSNRLKASLDDEVERIRQKREVGSPYALLSQACRRLSANADDNRQYPLANEFHYWSMDALSKESWSHIRNLNLTLESLAKKETWRDIRKHFGLVTTLYGALSGYGVRAARAFWILFWMSAFFAFLYMVAGPSELRAGPLAIYQSHNPSLATAFSQPDFVPPYMRKGPKMPVVSASELRQSIVNVGHAFGYSLGALARLRPEPQPDGPSWFQFFVTAEGILGPLQIALLALAIRRQVMR